MSGLPYAGYESLESTLKRSEQRYGLNKGYVLNFSLSPVLSEEKNDWRQ